MKRTILSSCASGLQTALIADSILERRLGTVVGSIAMSKRARTTSAASVKQNLCDLCKFQKSRSTARKGMHILGGFRDQCY